MTTRSWSTSEFAKDFGHCQNLKEVISAVEQRMWTDGHVICEVRINGLKLGEQDEIRFAQESLPSIQSFSILSDSPKNLLRKTLEDVLFLIPALHEKCCFAADCFRLYKFEAAHSTFSELLELCRYLTDVLFVLKNQYPNAISESTEMTYRNVVREVLSAFEQKDYVLLSDVLEYELTNVLVEFKLEISKLKDRASLG